MSDNNSSDLLDKLKLGKHTDYVAHYDPSQLEPVPRQLMRSQLAELPHKMQGYDVWTGFEVSWLNPKGKPIVRIAEFTFSADSTNLVESKSFKLYLNSFNQSPFVSDDQVSDIMATDLANISGSAVQVDLYDLASYSAKGIHEIDAINLDTQDITVSEYDYDPSLLKVEQNTQAEVSETLISHLLKSNCLVTSQPDWGSVVVEYTGTKICHESLLKYIISFRGHNEFHEHCVERIYTDLQSRFKFKTLTVYARYTRRGGLDINPVRTSCEKAIANLKLVRLVRQ